jgi:2-amino-4-hydroxy-6-hydroxymethyldihydropteridine diphosphokinase
MSEFCEHRNGGNRAFASIAFIGVGANLPGLDGISALITCRRAVAALDLFPGMRLRGLSRWFLSAPVPPSDQPDYVNAVASLQVDPGMTVDPAALLAYLLQVEHRFGRKRDGANAARTLDLDIIAVGNWVRDEPDPILPHPRAHLRAFVLAPLNDIAPDWIHPILGRSAAALLAALPPQDIRVLTTDL